MLGKRPEELSPVGATRGASNKRMCHAELFGGDEEGQAKEEEEEEG